MLLVWQVQAQNGSIIGQVLYQKEDSVLRVSYANLLLQRPNGSRVSGTIADEQGKFEFHNVPAGTFGLVVQAVGFEKLTLANVTISAEKPTLTLNEITLRESSTQLKEVTIVGQKEEVEYDVDRKIFNVGDNPAYAGGSAVEVLQNIPSMTVDIDGTISMRGNNKITVLIDGKPAGLAGSSRQAILEQIPANMIEKIEVISNPSSRYDADGSGGVINIITKKNKYVGYNGTVSANVGTGEKYNMTGNLNFRNKNWNFFGSTDWRNQRFGQIQTIERLSNSTDRTGKVTQYQLLQQSDGFGRTENTTSRIGTDWFMSPKQTMSFSLTFRDQQPTNLDQRSSRTLNLTLPDTPPRLFTRTANRLNQALGKDWVIGYQHTYDNPKKKWTIDAVFTTNTGHDGYDFVQRDYLNTFDTPSTANPRLEQSLNIDQNYALTLQTDVDNSLGKKKKGKIEYGAKATIRQNDTDYSFLTYNYTTAQYLRNEKRSNHFIYDEHVYAGYLSMAHPFKKWSVQAGIRTELTQIGINQQTQQIRKDTSYLTLFPSLFVSRPLGKGHRVQLSVSRRINRPAYTALNPFVNYSDSLNLQTGNPYLKPELVNAYEAGYNYLHKKGFSINGTLFYRQTVNSVVRTRQLLVDNITISNWQNLGSNNSYGLELVVVQPLTKWWKINGNWSFFKVDLVSQNQEGAFIRSRNSWTARLNSQMQFGKKAGLQLSGNYRSPIVTVQGSVEAVYSVDMGFRLTVLNNKGTINLRVTDVFNTQKTTSLTEGLGFTSHAYTDRETRVLYLIVSYRFNKKLETRAERRERKRVNEERAGEN